LYDETTMYMSRANAHRKNVIDNQLVIFVIQPSLFFFKRVNR
jgi:hypothetical protein